MSNSEFVTSVDRCPKCGQTALVMGFPDEYMKLVCDHCLYEDQDYVSDWFEEVDE